MNNTGTSKEKAGIIFAVLPVYLDFLAGIFKKNDHDVFYLGLSSLGQSAQAERQRAVKLREAGIVPLPVEGLPRLTGALEGLSDPEMKLQDKTNQIASARLLAAFAGLYPNNADVARKLRIAVQSMSAGQVLTVGQVNCWARAHQGRNHVLIYPSVRGLLVFGLVSNVRLLVVPVNLLVEPLIAAAQVMRKIFRSMLDTPTRNKHPVATTPLDSGIVRISRAVFVTHAGLSYGNLFQKTIFYSDRTDSELHPSNMLHFDYCGLPSPSEEIRWVCLGSERQAFLAGWFYALAAIVRGIVCVRSFAQIMGLLLLARFYAIFMAYSKKLEAYPDLKVALIDYEVLCPKALLLAFESRNVKTVATQERFIGSFCAIAGTIVDSYLCGSEYVAEVMRKSSAYSVDHYVPVGQYKSDHLFAARQSLPPLVLQTPIKQGRKIITALGFHTHMDWYRSQSDPWLNWTAHQQFLEDMIRLSRDIPNSFIIIRYKTVDWLSLPVFAETVHEIESSANMAISKDYEKSFFSYDLCANSHLVIAKHTSLGDECLTAGIPVLFHEYTHNFERLLASAFDYSPTRIMCFRYQDLLARVKIILNSDPHAMTPDYEYLKSVVYGGLGDGKVRERIHAHIESMLRDDVSENSIGHSSAVNSRVYSH